MNDFNPSKTLYIKLKILNVLVSFFIKNINLIIKFIFLIALSINSADIISTSNLVDLILSIVEDESNIQSNTAVSQSTETDTEVLKDGEVDFDSMSFNEWVDYLWENEPKVYWFLVVTFSATAIFCVWLMWKLIGPAWPPKEPPLTK